MIIDGKQLANEILANLQKKLSTKGSDPKMEPTMAIILVGENPASLSYIKQKQKSAEKIGIKVILKQFPNTISQIDLISQISQINSNPNVHGIIIQRPVPIFSCHFGQTKCEPESISINESVSPKKDIDGFHPQTKFFPPVGLAVLHTLQYCHSKRNKTSFKKINLSNSLKIKNLKLKIFLEWLSTQEIVLLGRGETGGKPIANTLDKFKIKYTQAHSKTLNTKDLLKQADIIISAVGIPNLITGEMIKKNAICIGVGISRLNVIARNEVTKQSAQTINNNSTIEQFNNLTISKLVGDFDESSISQKASFYTPVPGGIGPLTVTFLLQNLVKAWRK